MGWNQANVLVGRALIFLGVAGTLFLWAWAAEPTVGNVPLAESLSETQRYGLELIVGRIEFLTTLAASLIGAAAAVAFGFYDRVQLSQIERVLVALAIWSMGWSMFFGITASTVIYGLLTQSMVPSLFMPALERPLEAQHLLVFAGAVFAAMSLFLKLWTSKGVP